MVDEHARRPNVFWIGPDAVQSRNLAGRAREALEEDAGLTTWEQDHGGSVSVRLVENLQTADVVLADVRGINANVLYEVGLAHAFERPVVCIGDSKDSIPFDLNDQQFLRVKTDEDGRIANPERFAEAIREYVHHAVTTQPVTAVTMRRLQQGESSPHSSAEGPQWRDLALAGQIRRLEAVDAAIDAQVLHLRYGVGRVVGWSSGQDKVVVAFAASTREFGLPDRQLFLAEVHVP